MRNTGLDEAQGGIKITGRNISNLNSLALSFPYGPTLTTIHDYWKNHSFE